MHGTNPSPAQLLEAIAGKKVLVIGDVMLDEYVFGVVERISPEAPVPVLRATSRKYLCGGAANVAHNILALKGIPLLIGRIGKDWAGKKLRELLSDLKMNTAGLISDPKVSTTLKTRFIGTSQQMLRVDVETITPPSSRVTRHIFDIFHSFLSEADAVVFSDYAKGMSSACGAEITQVCKRKNIPLIVDPKPATADHFVGAHILTPNEMEASLIAKIPVKDDDSLEKIAVKIVNDFHLNALLITRGKKGMTLFQGGEMLHFPATVREIYDVTGAGDTVSAVLGLCTAARIPLKEAVTLANLAAGVVVQKLGASPVSPEEILSLSLEEKVLPLPSLLHYAELWKKQGEIIVFTNGVFDLFHPGHLHLLQEAKKLGDRLIVAINSDISVKKIKPPGRPIVHQQERARIVASLHCVDAVILFDDPTPLSLIQQIRPDVLVKGADYSPDEVVGKEIVEEYGGKVVLVPLLPGYSTTSLIHSIRRSG
ncbi:MAG: D-glycero-beta-D-manno-heptose-7-phosphate kinase [bacterium JZ-2024 1]